MGDRRLGVIGLGYAGLPLALSFVEAGLEVVGVEADPQRVADLRAGRSPVDGVSDDRLKAAIEAGFRVAGTNGADLAAVDAVLVCVPTPINDAKEPDLGHVLSAGTLVATCLRPGQLVVLQSTTYPGTTNGPFREVLERSALVAGRDFDLAYAPERVNPGDPASSSRDVPRLVAGVTQAGTDRTAALFHVVNTSVVELSSPDAAEMAKLFENVFRNVNIALVNELALLCERMGLDVWEIVDAAATKPFGFMRFVPGPGVGGHCIPVDPYYLAWRARQFGFADRFVEVAGDINLAMPDHVVELVRQALNGRGRALKGARMGLIGVAFKPDVRDTRNSPAEAIFAQLAARGARLAYHDPLVPTYRPAGGSTFASQPLLKLIEGSDVIVVVTAHALVDWDLVYSKAPLVVDAVGSSRGRSLRPRQVLRLGAGWAPGSIS